VNKNQNSVTDRRSFIANTVAAGAGFAFLSELLMGPDGEFITGSDFLMDGGVTASYWYGELAAERN
jgi:hypothetical protein